MDEIKVFVNPSNNAVLICPRCGRRKTLGVGLYKGKKHTVKVKCTCEHHFTVHLDFRKHYRKQADLAGAYSKKEVDLGAYYVNLSHGGEWDDAVIDSRSVNCKIKNISLGGLGIHPLGPHVIKEEDELRVLFILDDPQKTKVDRSVVVVSVTSNLVGCRFTEPVEHDKALGFYLLP